MTLIGYWPLNEDSDATEAKDHSGNENHGTINDGGDSTVPGANGILGQNAYSFDGSNDYISISSYNNFNSFTQSAWVKFDSVDDGNTDTIIRLMVNNDTKLEETGGKVRQTIWDGNTNNSVSVTVNSTDWTLITSTWDGSTVRIYKNGFKEDSTSFSGSSVQKGEADSHIGAGVSSGNPSSYINGKISEVRIYDRPLTQSEIQYLYSVGKRGQHVTSKKTS